MKGGFYDEYFNSYYGFWNPFCFDNYRRKIRYLGNKNRRNTKKEIKLGLHYDYLFYI